MPGYVLKRDVIARGNEHYKIVDAPGLEGKLIEFSEDEAKELKDEVSKNSLFIENEAPRKKIYAAVNRQTRVHLGNGIYWRKITGEVELVFQKKDGSYRAITGLSDETAKSLKENVFEKYRKDSDEADRKALFRKINELSEIEKLF